MPDIADVAWSEHDERNSEAVPNGWPTGAFPAYTDLVGQMMMGATKRFWNKINPIYQTIGTGDNYVVQTEIGIDQINLYEILCIRIDRSNTTSTPTLQFGATNARTIVKAGPSGYIPLVAGDMFAGNSHTFWYNGAFYILVDPAIIVGGTVQPYSPNLTTWAAITRATGFDTWVATPSSANLAVLVGDETGTGALVFGTGPTLSAPLLAGGTSGTTILQASANASGTLTFPAATDTLVARATTDTLTNKTINGSNNTITNVSLTTGVTGALPIANGGTGQTTAGAAFDALAPTTTRGDIVFRNATTNARLAASTAGYHLQTNGASADPTWAGFLQAGASAVTRTWQDKARERISVKDFGAVGDGVTNDTVAIQAAETYRASVGGTLIFPPGTYLNSGITVNRASGGSWVGYSAMLIPTTNAVVFITASGAVLSNSSRSFTVQGLTFNGNALANITCYSEASAFFTVLEDITIVNVVYAGIFQRGHGITLNNIKQYGSGQWLFTGVGTGVGDNVFDVNITNVTHESSGGASWASAPSWFYFYRAVNVNMANVVTGSLDGAAVGILLQGDVEGFFATNTIIVYPTVGIESIIGADGIYPAYVYLNNFAVDQPTNTGIDLAGAVNRLTNVNVTFGDARTNTGPGIVMRAASSDSYLSGVRISHMYNSGLVIEAGAQVKANGLELTTNHVSGTGFDLDIGASTAANVNFYGKNNLGTVNATGQRIVNGVTSKQVARSTTPASTGANTTPTTLQSYSIPASTLKPGQTVKLEAYGTFAANANNKTIELVFGSQQVSVHIGTFNNIAWFARGEILVTGASTQSWNGNVFVNGQALTSTQGTSSVTDTSAILVQLRATNGTASAGDITCNGFTADILD